MLDLQPWKLPICWASPFEISRVAFPTSWSNTFFSSSRVRPRVWVSFLLFATWTTHHHICMYAIHGLSTQRKTTSIRLSVLFLAIKWVRCTAKWSEGGDSGIEGALRALIVICCKCTCLSRIDAHSYCSLAVVAEKLDVLAIEAAFFGQILGGGDVGGASNSVLKIKSVAFSLNSLCIGFQLQSDSHCTKSLLLAAWWQSHALLKTKWKTCKCF